MVHIHFGCDQTVNAITLLYIITQSGYRREADLRNVEHL